VLQSVAVCCSVCVLLWMRKYYIQPHTSINVARSKKFAPCVAACCSASQCVAVCCSVLQCVAVCCSMLQCVAVCCSVLQCIVVCCSVLQYVVVAWEVFHPVLYRVAKTHRIPYLYRSFSAKVTYI